MKEAVADIAKSLQDQMDGNAKDLLDVVKREKGDRERDVELVKRRIEDEKTELQQTINRDRDNMTKKLGEEHDQRRIEQMGVTQRLENTEKGSKNDITELFARIKRYEEEARIDNDEVRQALARTTSTLEEKTMRDKRELREIMDHETSDLGRRVDKCNLERINESADMQAKVGMLGKSASRHLEQLKHTLHREIGNLIDLASKPGSVVFTAYRDEGHTDGGECYVTFSACTVNLGNGFIPKSGVFSCPEPGLYMFTLTVRTYDGKKCLLILRKNEKDVCALIDQDGNENRGKTMISQTCFMELDISDRVQVYAVTGTGFTDGKSSHYTQFSGALLRLAPDTIKAARQGLREDEELSIAEGSLRGFTPARGFTPSRGFTPTRDPSRGFTPTPGGGERNGDGGKGKKNGHAREEETPAAADAKPERKKSDLAKPTKDDDPKPASEPEAEKVKKSSVGGETKQPVPTTRKGSLGGSYKAVPNTPGTAAKTVPNTSPPGTAAKTVPNTPTAAAKTAGSNKEQDKKSDGSGFYGFLKRA